tara:strand:+ start:11968 stop:12264 length:297 start_codon:yes stop_codon:yes gene_type:complete
MDAPKKDQVDLKLRPDSTHVLVRQEGNRGLLVANNKDGSYEVAYWINDKVPYPIEIIIDGKSITKDAKVVKFNFHPEIDTQKSAEGFEMILDQILKGK